MNEPKVNITVMPGAQMNGYVKEQHNYFGNVLQMNGTEAGKEPPAEKTSCEKVTKKGRSNKPSAPKPQKPREPMTFRHKGSVTEAHLTVLFSKLTGEGWIDGNEADFKTLFSGRRDEDCLLTWMGVYGQSVLVELFKQLLGAGLILLPEGFTLTAILDGHFNDKEGQRLTRLDKGDPSTPKALPVIQECVKLLKTDLRNLINGSTADDEDFQELYDPYDHQDMHLHKR